MDIALRPYQTESVTRFFDLLDAHRRQLIVLPTGAGKTVVFGAIARRWHEEERGGPIAVLAHRGELLTQAADKLRLVWPGVTLGRVQAQRDEQDADVLLCSTQTLVAGRKLKRRPSLVIYDEAHHSRAEGSMNVLDRLGVFDDDGPALLGVTATPSRSDGTQLGDVFTHLTYEMSILDAILDGYLCDVRGKRVEIPGLDLKRLRLTAGDYNARDLSQAMNQDEALQAVVDAVVDVASDRKSILFAVDVAHAHALATSFSRTSMKAAAVDGDMPEAERPKVLQAFAKGKIQVLINCQLLTEGFDEPSVDGIIIARPTRSRSLYVQMVGRALRLHPAKENALILDLTGASDDKNLQTFTRLMSTQKKDKPDESVDAVSLAEDMQGHESVIEWQKRVVQAGREAVERREREVRDINLFADRSKFRWARSGESFAINFGDDHWAYLLKEDGAESGWWPVLEVAGGKLLPLYDRAIPITFAQGVVEAYLATLEEKSQKLIAKDVDWRNTPITERQKHVLDKYRIAYDNTWTRGMASDELAKRFAKRRLREVGKAWDPAKVRNWLADPTLRARFE
ncbi:MAG: DEAD/DEAH box helicase [Bacilli bacterium]